MRTAIRQSPHDNMAALPEDTRTILWDWTKDRGRIPRRHLLDPGSVLPTRRRGALSLPRPGGHEDEPEDDAERETALGRLQLTYEQTEVAFLASAFGHRRSIEATDVLLDLLSVTRAWSDSWSRSIGCCAARPRGAHRGGGEARPTQRLPRRLNPPAGP